MQAVDRRHAVRADESNLGVLASVCPGDLKSPVTDKPLVVDDVVRGVMESGLGQGSRAHDRTNTPVSDEEWSNPELRSGDIALWSNGSMADELFLDQPGNSSANQPHMWWRILLAFNAVYYGAHVVTDVTRHHFYAAAWQLMAAIVFGLIAVFPPEVLGRGPSRSTGPRFVWQTELFLGMVLMWLYAYATAWVLRRTLHHQRDLAVVLIFLVPSGLAAGSVFLLKKRAEGEGKVRPQ